MSGAITSAEQFHYGKFITRMKAPNKPGTVAAFFTYFNDTELVFEGDWNEIDFEVVPSVV